MSKLPYKIHQISSNNKLFRKTFIDEDADVLFMPGCSLSGYDEKIILNIYNYLRGHIKNIGITFSCCYKPSIMIKDYKSFEKYYKNLDETLNTNNVKKVITSCPNCYKSLSENSKNIEVYFLLDVIREFGLDNRLIGYYSDLNIEFAIHDSCAIRGVESIYISARDILKSLGIKYSEFEKNRSSSMCCGAIFTDNENKKKQLEKRCSQTKSDYTICYCETCVKFMINGGKNSIHILDLIFNEEYLNKDKFTQYNKSSINSWINRYKLNNRRKYE
ncbi:MULTISPECIES: (Fe-S)-binding protein [Romboutsia]|uniref:Iron-sulfur binding reductase n=1 Tax=Romboutsia hominis TaxID=1507512 RepID=A0A2P2BS88_9FIRM|nr:MULTISPECIES: (Fe-S)-binding protein [Romboutsia]MCH1960469.1 (Fe-S)-binding protein [Romboutsia hominis]MCH1969098.1 (Fe-S)-binding protein [Romboutsia hominis]MDB8805988.1 (Fe-S)-binding protein [Romboutsia sp. 1001216sp1]MDB8807568.1 (Fe-S)-binding protein [Romboutsia sp. 1001216sp1]MDB8811191.1 (Fe-S)-binding protein [Romboutsia sp. 1001216sp1]